MSLGTNWRRRFASVAAHNHRGVLAGGVGGTAQDE